MDGLVFQIYKDEISRGGHISFFLKVDNHTCGGLIFYISTHPLSRALIAKNQEEY